MCRFAKRMESADKKRKLGILFPRHGESEEEIKQFRESRRHLRADLKAAKKGRKATMLDSMKLLHGPHYETVRIDKSGTEDRIKMRILPETQHLIVTETWSLKTCKYNKTGYELDLKIPSQIDVHLDWFFTALRINKLPMEIIALFPNVKEITESVAAMNLLRRRVDLTAAGCLVLDVGAGSSPRTGGIIAHIHPNTWVHSIDPQMNAKWVLSSGCKNLSANACMIEDWIDGNIDLIKNASMIAITAVHSHAPLENYVPKLRTITDCKLTVLTMQCCVPQILSDELQASTGVYLTFRKTDMGIHSPHRTMGIWTNNDTVVLDEVPDVHKNEPEPDADL